MISKLSLIPKNRNFALTMLETFLECRIFPKKTLNSLLKQFFDVVWMFSKVFLSVELEMIQEYTFKKNIFFGAVCLFQTFFCVYILKIIMSTLFEKIP